MKRQKKMKQREKRRSGVVSIIITRSRERRRRWWCLNDNTTLTHPFFLPFLPLFLPSPSVAADCWLVMLHALDRLLMLLTLSDEIWRAMPAPLSITTVCNNQHFYYLPWSKKSACRTLWSYVSLIQVNVNETDGTWPWTWPQSLFPIPCQHLSKYWNSYKEVQHISQPSSRKCRFSLCAIMRFTYAVTTLAHWLQHTVIKYHDVFKKIWVTLCLSCEITNCCHLYTLPSQTLLIKSTDLSSLPSHSPLTVPAYHHSDNADCSSLLSQTIADCSSLPSQTRQTVQAYCHRHSRLFQPTITHYTADCSSLLSKTLFFIPAYHHRHCWLFQPIITDNAHCSSLLSQTLQTIQAYCHRHSKLFQPTITDTADCSSLPSLTQLTVSAYHHRHCWLFQPNITDTADCSSLPSQTLLVVPAFHHWHSWLLKSTITDTADCSSLSWQTLLTVPVTTTDTADSSSLPSPTQLHRHCYSICCQKCCHSNLSSKTANCSNLS